MHSHNRSLVPLYTAIFPNDDYKKNPAYCRHMEIFSICSGDTNVNWVIIAWGGGPPFWTQAGLLLIGKQAFSKISITIAHNPPSQTTGQVKIYELWLSPLHQYQLILFPARVSITCPVKCELKLLIHAGIDDLNMLLRIVILEARRYTWISQWIIK